MHDYSGKPTTTIEEAVQRLADASPERDGGSFAAIDPAVAREALANLERETSGACGTCDGSGILFTQPVQDAGMVEPHADNVTCCGECKRYAGDVEAAQAYARAHGGGYVASVWDEVGIVSGTYPIVRADYAEACIEVGQPGPDDDVDVTVRVEYVHGPKPRTWATPWEAMLDLGDAVRILLDNPGANVRTYGGIILEASEYMRAQVLELEVPDLRDAALLRRAQAEEVTTGLFVGLVKLAEQVAEGYAAAEGRPVQRGDVGSLIDGLAENLEGRFGL